MSGKPYLQLSDAALVEKLKAGDNDAFSAIYNRYWEKLSIAAYKVLKEHDIAQDLVQDVFVDLWQQHHKKIISNLEAYLYQAIRYRVFKYIRDSKKASEYLEKINSQLVDNSLEDQLALGELQKAIHSHLQSLPYKCRKIFMLSRFENKSHQEIAEFFGLSPKTVENQIGKALKYLKHVIYIILIFLITS